MLELSLDSNDSLYQIRAYQAETFTINDTIFNESVLLTPTQLFSPWPPQQFSQLTADHLSIILTLNPTVVLIGTGPQQYSLPIEWLMPFYEKKIGVELMTTSAACRTFNVLAAEGRNVVAALIIR